MVYSSYIKHLKRQFVYLYLSRVYVYCGVHVAVRSQREGVSSPPSVHRVGPEYQAPVIRLSLLAQLTSFLQYFYGSFLLLRLKR